MTSYNAPTSDEVERTIPLLSAPQHEAYFFARLENPMWIAPLEKRGMFRHPPKTVSMKGGGQRFPLWPAGQYLARMAAKAPEEVAAIFARMKTDNPSVVGDMLQAALATPVGVATALVPVVCDAARRHVLHHHFGRASDLCSRFADFGHIDEALELARALFRPPRIPKGRGKPSDRDAYWYKAGLKKIVSVLAVHRPLEFLPELCKWLKATAKGKHRAEHSHLWRPAIEEHEQNREYEFAGVMVGFVRKAFEAAIAAERLTLPTALELLEHYSDPIFKRISVYLVGEYGASHPSIVSRAILNPSLFDDDQFKHEYGLLVGRCLPLLSPEQQREWLAWVDTGPDTSGFGQVNAALGLPVPGEDERQRFVDHWRFHKLHWARVHLDGERLEFYRRMVAEYGEPWLADMTIRVGRAWGDVSPLSLEELSAMAFADALEAVSSWQPTGSRVNSPSLSGLASSFEKYLATDPAGFSAHARAVQHRSAILVRGFISQMTEAVKSARGIELAAVLDLCEWVVDQPIAQRTTPQQVHERLVDPSWQWCREAVSQFLKQVCNAESEDAPTYPPQQFRERMWRMVAALCRDTAHSSMVRDMPSEDPRVHDYLDFAINSPRGRALDAAFAYARWVGAGDTEYIGTQEVVRGGFSAMPEVRDALEWQVAPDNRSVAGLAIIGSHVDLLYWIDREWLAANADRLFQLEGIEDTAGEHAGWAAWNAFLIWVQPHVTFFRLFPLQFAYAVGQAAMVTLPEHLNPDREPMHHLGEQLMLAYGRGLVSLTDEGSLLHRFLDGARPELRRHAIGFIGEALGADGEVPAETIERFQQLWDVYWVAQGKTDAKDSPASALFGPWFSSGAFPADWALERFEDFVQVNPTPEPDYAIVERLAEIASADVGRAVRILDTMVRGDTEGWRIHGWDTPAKQILRQGLSAGGDVRERAVTLIDFLGRRGYVGFGQLLRP